MSQGTFQTRATPLGKVWMLLPNRADRDLARCTPGSQFAGKWTKHHRFAIGLLLKTWLGIGNALESLPCSSAQVKSCWEHISWSCVLHAAATMEQPRNLKDNGLWLTETYDMESTWSGLSF